jgi:hypothetical protein
MIGQRFAFLCFVFLSCNETEEVRVNKFRDIRGFFSEEAKRLEKQKTIVNKTVRRNGIFEKKNNISPVWDTELSLFSESDINKPAWRDSYRVHIDSTGTSYTALDNKLRTRSIRIKKNKMDKLIELTVVNRTSNYLYSSSEELLYIPDSLYRIIKIQDVVLLGKNSYEINGIF